MPSNSTCVPASKVENLPSAPGAFTTPAAGPMPDPQRVTISPGDTPPARNVAALVTPPALIAGRPPTMVYVAVTAAKLATVACTLAVPAAVPRVTPVEARPLAELRACR